jgi:hypothetical protein
VGSEQEEAIAEVRGTNGARGETVPFRKPPARCQAPEDFLERSATVNVEKSGHVLDKQPSRSDVDDVPPRERPEPSFIVDALALSGDAGALAGDSGSDEIHSAAIRAAREGFQIVVDRTAIQAALDHSTCEDGSGVGLPLDSTHKTNSGASKLDSEAEPPVSGAEFEHGSGTNNHKVYLDAVGIICDR